MDHPETKPGEQYVDGVRTLDWPYKHLKGLKTMRLGEIDYDLEGNPMDPFIWRPLFVSTKEVGTYKYIMARRRANLKAGKNADGSPYEEGGSTTGYV